MNKKIKTILIICFIALVLVIAALIYKLILNKSSGDANYSVVYLTNGEIYIGKPISFSEVRLTDIYLLQVIKDSQDPTKSNFQLQPLKQMIWSPKELYFEKNNILFYGPLEETSRIAETLRQNKK